MLLCQTLGKGGQWEPQQVNETLLGALGPMWSLLSSICLSCQCDWRLPEAKLWAASFPPLLQALLL